jgi:hypothetical protein
MDDRKLLQECIKTRGELGERMLAAEARVRTLEEALRVLTSATDEVLRGWDAKRQLDSGFTGMGHNILTEKVGKYSSIYCWEQGRKGVEEARAALRLPPDRPFDTPTSGLAAIGWQSRALAAGAEVERLRESIKALVEAGERYGCNSQGWLAAKRKAGL